MHIRHILVASALCLAAAPFLTGCGQEAEADPPAESGTAPIRALLVTGGCCHDYDTQKQLISEGISIRANVEWTIAHQGGDDRDAKIPLYEDPDWADGYDVVLHNECFGGVRDVDYIHRITEAHRAGVPAVMLHCSAHSYRLADTDEWRKLLGATSMRHEGHRPLAVKNLAPNHPVMAGFPDAWDTPHGELYEIEKLWPHATALGEAYGEDTDTDHPCIWVNEYGDARVFTTTLGHHNETVEHQVYLDLVTRGLLWAAGKLTDDGEPAPGYGPADDR